MLWARLIYLTVIFSVPWVGLTNPNNCAALLNEVNGADKLSQPANLTTNGQAKVKSLAEGRSRATVTTRPTAYANKNLLWAAAVTSVQESKTESPGVKTSPAVVKESPRSVSPDQQRTASGTPKPPKPDPVPIDQQAKTPEARSQSILQMVEGHETEVKMGLIVAAFAFVLGWVCGVSYYERRERKWRHKLRF